MTSRGQLLVSMCKKKKTADEDESNNESDEMDVDPTQTFPNSTCLDVSSDEFSQCDDSDADPDFDPTSENKRKKTYFNIQNILCSTNQSNFISLSDHLDLPSTSGTNLFHQRDGNMQVIEEVLTNIIDNVCKEDKKYHNKTLSEKHPLLPACDVKCRRSCSIRFCDSDREKIRDAFWKLGFGERRLFLDSHVKQINVKTRMQEADSSKRNFSLKYFLPANSQAKSSDDVNEHIIEDVQVCKIIFLHTLGLKTDGMAHFKDKRNSDGGIAKTTDNRGAAARAILTTKKAVNEDTIITHINSFNPVVSHYNLNHAPNRRYLSSELTISDMWKDFCQYRNVSYDLYRGVFKKQNIGFSKPSQDECEICKVYKIHDNVEQECECLKCKSYKEHKVRYTEAREAYTKDKGKVLDPNEKIYSVDMQKVLLLPKLSTKNSFFTSRLVVFNETFASLKNEENICVMWHEAIRGRCASDVSSAYYNIIKNSSSTVTKFIFWADNCSAQNKNWVLYSSFVCFVNAQWGPEEITVKYFEPAHSFMAADSVHGRISTEMKKHPNIYDFDDLISVINKSSKKTKCMVLNISDFFPFTDGSKQRRNNNIPFMENIRVVQFRKGFNRLFYKDQMQGQFKESDFLKSKFLVQLPPLPYMEPTGLNTEKKQKIIKILCPSFEDERKKLFWLYLPSNDNSRDLCTTSEH